MNKQAIIIVGNIFDGLEFFGPFAYVEDAIEWAERNVRKEWLVASLNKTADDDDK